MEKNRVLIVDDAVQDIAVVMGVLSAQYAVQVATSGLNALEQAKGTYTPDVVLLDVSMPEMDGYEVCRRFKSDGELKEIDIIFVSANDSIEEKLKGYDVGGLDYVTKPVNPAELMRKIELAIQSKQERKSILEEKNYAFNTAMTAMSTAGELGVVMDFFRKLSGVENHQQLAEQVAGSLRQYDLKTMIRLKNLDGDFYLDSEGAPAQLAKELLTKVAESGRIIEWNERAVFNFGSISVLIKNMSEDADLRGRYRETVAMIIEGATTKLEVLNRDVQLSQLIRDAQQALTEVDQEQLEHKQKTQKLVESLTQDLERSFLAWELTETQEDTLMEMVNNTIDKSVLHFEAGEEIDQKMRTVLDRLIHI
ncbi:MAG: response regulator [Oceanospirillum sp.]|nr:response regulator [Oceanospirillum sp.]